MIETNEKLSLRETFAAMFVQAYISSGRYYPKQMYIDESIEFADRLIKGLKKDETLQSDSQ